MVVERRSETRRKARVVAYLGLRGRSPARCKTVDLSASGALVKTPGRILEHGERVKLVIALSFGKVVKTYHRNAIVVRVSEAGVALRTFRKRAHRSSEDFEAGFNIGRAQ
jgi:hypothetical protein